LIESPREPAPNTCPPPACRQTGQAGTLVKSVVQYFLDEIIAELGKGGRLEFRDFGVFETRMRAARIAQNPKTITKVQVPANRTVKFKPGRLMKQRLDGQAPGR